MAYVFDPTTNTLIDDEDKSLGNKLALNDDEFQKLLEIPGVFRASEAPQPPPKQEIIDREAINRFIRDNRAEGGRLKAAFPLLAPALLPYAAAFLGTTATGLVLQKQVQNYFENNPDAIDKFKDYVSRSIGYTGEGQVFGPDDKDRKEAEPIILSTPDKPVGITDYRESFGDDELAKELLKTKPETFPAETEKLPITSGETKPIDQGPIIFEKKKTDLNDPLDEATESLLIQDAVERLKKKEMDPSKRDKRTKLAVDLNLPVTRSMYEIRKGDYLNKRLQTLKDKGVNFNSYFSIPEISDLIGSRSSSGVQSYVNDKKIPTVKQGLFKLVKLNDFLNVYQGTKERVEKAPPIELGTLARTDFLKEVGGNFYQRFKDMRRPKFLPPEVKTIYEKYELGAIEGGHPFPVEFFTKKFGKNNTLQKDRQIDWIYRNKDKLFDKNDLVFQSTEVNKFYKTKIGELKKLYKELAPLVNKYEGKGPVTNEKDIKTIESLNNEIMDVIAKSEFDAKEFIEESPNSVDLKRMSKGGLHGALFNTDTGEVSLYAPGKEAGFVEGSVGEIKTKEGVVPGEKLKLGADYLDIVNQVITDEEDKKIFTDYISEKLLPKFQKGGGVEITPLPRINFGNGGAAAADENFAAELEYFLTNEDAELPKLSTYSEPNNPIQVINDIIDPRNYPYYADVLLRSGVRIGEFATRILPATGKLINDLITKPAFKIQEPSEDVISKSGYAQDFGKILSSDFKGTGIFSEFLENITPTKFEKTIGLDKLIEKEEQRLKDTGSTIGPKVFADTFGLGAEVAAPIFPGLKLLDKFIKPKKIAATLENRKEMDIYGKPFTLETEAVRRVAQKILDNKRISVGEKDPLDVLHDTFGIDFSLDVKNFTDEYLELILSGKTPKPLDTLLKNEGYFDFKIPANPVQGMRDDDIRDLIKNIEQENILEDFDVRDKTKNAKGGIIK